MTSDKEAEANPSGREENAGDGQKEPIRATFPNHEAKGHPSFGPAAFIRGPNDNERCEC